MRATVEPTTRLIRATLLAALPALAAIALASCAVEPPSAPQPTTGQLQVTVTTTGADLDDNGYKVWLNDRRIGTLAANESLTLTVTASTYVVRLSGLAPNCAVMGDPDAHGNRRAGPQPAGGWAHDGRADNFAVCDSIPELQ